MRFRLFVADEYKPISSVPKAIYALLALALLAQITLHWQKGRVEAVAQTEYGIPPKYEASRLVSFGDHELASKLLVLRVQAFDNQPGVSIPFAELDYFALSDWMDLVVQLDEKSEYPHFLMSKLYLDVADDDRSYIAAEWVRQKFAERPNERWEWMLHTTNFVKHFMEDEELALEYAREMREYTDPEKVPFWVRQYEAYFSEGVDQFEAAATLLANQLEAGEITEPQEFTFTLQRLEKIVTQMLESGQITDKAEWDEKIAKIEALKEEYLSQQE